MKQRGLKRLRGVGCNSGWLKMVVGDWKSRYDLSGGYRLKVLPRIKNEITVDLD
jgi:hypothetical protein